jgi:hypothetical protein
LNLLRRPPGEFGALREVLAQCDLELGHRLDDPAVGPLITMFSVHPVNTSVTVKV